jgi:error-prone DNA polymerase
MGFYHPATIVKDAQRHGTEVLPADVSRSGWKCRVEKGAPGLELRLGLRFVRGLRASAGEAIEREAARAPFDGVKDLARRSALREDELTALAHAGALAGLGLTRREALWQAAAAAPSTDAGPLYARLSEDSPSPLPEMSRFEETVADYETSEMTAGPHLVAHLRARLRREGVLSVADLARARDGDEVALGGCVIVRQRPGTARGFVFLSLEDETGIAQAIVRPDLFAEHRALLVGSPGLVVEGRLQRKDGTLSVKAARFRRLPLAEEPGPDGDAATPQSHDFR